VLRASGQPLHLVEPLSECEEGTLWRTDRPGWVARLHRALDAGRIARLEALLAMTPIPGIAWPIDLALREGEPVGVLLPAPRGLLPLDQLGDLDLHRRHQAILALARALAALHGAGGAAGPHHPGRIGIDRDGTAMLGEGDLVRPSADEEARLADRLALADAARRVLLGAPPFLAPSECHCDLARGLTRGDMADAPGEIDGSRREKVGGPPSAAAWVRWLDRALDDLVVCAVNPRHFHAGHHDSCPWCARAAAGADDPFPPRAGAELDPVALAKRFEGLARRGEGRAALVLWNRHAALATAPFAEPQRRLARRLVREIGQLDRFLSAYRLDPTADELLWQLWQGPPTLADSATAGAEPVDGTTAAALAQTIGERALALAELREAAQRADETPGLVRERALLAGAERHAALIETRRVRLRPLVQRVALARRRMQRWDTLEAALAADSDEEILAAWGEDGVLDGFMPAQAVKPRLALAHRRRHAIEAFLAHAAQSPDDEAGLWRHWAACPELDGAPAATRPEPRLGGETVAARAQTARRRLDRRVRFREALRRRPLDPAALVAAWDEADCLGDPTLRPAVAVVRRAENAVARLDQIDAAMRAVPVDHQALAALWDEAMLADFDMPAATLTAIRRAVARTAPPGVPFRPPQGTRGVRVAPDGTEVRFLWPVDGPDYAIVAARADRFPADPDDVEDLSHRVVLARPDVSSVLASDDPPAILAGVTLALATARPLVSIWAARAVGAAAVAWAQPLRLAPPGLARLAHKFRWPWAGRGAWRAHLESDLSFDLPPLVLLARRDRPPEPGDPEARVLMRVPAGPIGPDLPFPIDLPGRPEMVEALSARWFIRLVPEDPREASWLDIETIGG
jgi:hypothetical protein